MEWISVKNQRPKTGTQNVLLFFNGKKEVTYGYAYDWKEESDSYIWFNDFDRETNEIATHWMPIPSPPKD